jgi:hypothetical protein
MASINMPRVARILRRLELFGDCEKKMRLRVLHSIGAVMAQPVLGFLVGQAFSGNAMVYFHIYGELFSECAFRY